MKTDMRRPLIAIFCAALLVLPVTASADRLSDQEQYIRTYSKVAVSEMYRSGIPASITLAQGLLESGAGKSRLATEGNNHFGIKCHNWTGGRIHHDDDAKGECFRKYRNASESFRDHSDFLRYKDRYKFLFDLEITDYEGWAYGLKKAGYATDPAYPRKLIKLIEDYKLYEFDREAAVGTEKSELSDDAASSAAGDSSKSAGSAAPSSGSAKLARTARKAGTKKYPPSPRSIEEPKPLDKSPLEEFSFNLSRQLYSQNGVPFVYSIEGETYASIASMYNLFPREILSFNDLDKARPLDPGTVVYLQRKKSQAAKGLEKHVWEKGETLWELSQRYGIRLKNLKKMNGVESESELIEGDLLNLRK